MLNGYNPALPLALYTGCCRTLLIGSVPHCATRNLQRREHRRVAVLALPSVATISLPMADFAFLVMRRRKRTWTSNFFLTFAASLFVTSRTDTFLARDLPAAHHLLAGRPLHIIPLVNLRLDCISAGRTPRHHILFSPSNVAVNLHSTAVLYKKVYLHSLWLLRLHPPRRWTVLTIAICENFLMTPDLRSRTRSPTCGTTSWRTASWGTTSNSTPLNMSTPIPIRLDLSPIHRRSRDLRPPLRHNGTSPETESKAISAQEEVDQHAFTSTTIHRAHGFQR